MKRASSPPEATFIMGPGSVPGLVATQKATRSMPLGPPSARSTVSIWVTKRAFSSLSGASSAATSSSNRLAAFARALLKVSAACS